MARSVEELVHRQILRWEEEARLVPPAETQPPEAPHAPMISVSRDYGGRGAAVGRRIADLLGFHLYGRELVDEIAQTRHVRRQVLESLDEHVQSQIDEMIRSQMSADFFSNTEFMHNLSQIVLALARHGRGVLVGRGAQFILSPEWTLRIRCTAPLAVRIARIAERDGISRAEARTRVLREDVDRDAFYGQHFSLDARDPAYYDVVFNTGSLSEEACAHLAGEAFRARFGKYGGLGLGSA